MEEKNHEICGKDLTEYLPIPQAMKWGDKEQDAFKLFRNKASDYITEEHTDWYIGRFLVARKWDVEKAVELFIDAMKWRKEENIDTILETFPHDYWFPFLCEYWPTSISTERYHWTLDKCPVMYERIGLLSPQLVDSVPLETLFKWHVYCIELMEKENKRIANEIGFSPGTILFEDLDALSAGHMYGKMTNLVQVISANDEARYPESVRKVYIVNPPAIFAMVMGLLKPFLDEGTLQKFSNGTPKEFKKEFDSVIGMQDLPKFLGGDLDWDPPAGGNVKKLMTAKGIVPKKISLGRREASKIDVDASAGQTIFIQVQLKRSDIGVFLTKKGDKKNELIKNKKYDCDTSPHLLSYVVEETGSFTIHLDNTDSPMMGRVVKVLHWVKDPIVLGGAKPEPEPEPVKESKKETDKVKKSKSSAASTGSKKKKPVTDVTK